MGEDNVSFEKDIERDRERGKKKGDFQKTAQIY